MQKFTFLQSGLNNGRTARWATSCMPIKFYISPCKFYSVAFDAEKYRSMVIRALREWENVSAGFVKFQLVSSLYESQINLTWRRVNRESLGNCNWNYDAKGRLYSGEIEIGISDGYVAQKYMHEDEVYHTVLHEIGHALGLGHSYFRNSIMFVPHQYGVTQINNNDIQTLLWLYRFECGLTPKEIASRYNQQTNDLDELVVKIASKQTTSKFEEVKNSIPSNQKDLLKEHQNIGDLKRYKLALQNIKVSDDVMKFLRETNIKKHPPQNKSDNQGF